MGDKGKINDTMLRWVFYSIIAQGQLMVGLARTQVEK